MKAPERASEAPTPKPLPLGYGKRCLPSALDAIAQVFIESVGSGLYWRRRFAKNDVTDLRCSPATAAGSRDTAGLKLRRNTAVGAHATCSDLGDFTRKRSGARIGLSDDRLSGSRAGFGCDLSSHFMRRPRLRGGSGAVRSWLGRPHRSGRHRPAFRRSLAAAGPPGAGAGRAFAAGQTERHALVRASCRHPCGKPARIVTSK